jgi:GTP-binding protein EngB required for normal cell division
VTAEDLATRLQALAAAAGADDLAAGATALAERVGEQRFYVACVGQFKRGKSTLLNALVGQPLLPVGVLPVTSVPTIVRFGQLGARVRTREGWHPIPPGELAAFVTEQQNPDNVKQVLAVEVLLAAPMLEHGLCLVDTPGLGSVQEANSAATREFVPHIDAALVVLGADPPLSGEELRLVEAIAADAGTLLFVMNKVDRVSEEERDQATAFLRGILVERLGIVPERIYQVAAAGGGSGPDWTALLERLGALARDQRTTLVAQALRRGIARLGGALSERLHEQRAALTRPVEAAERRVEELRRLHDGAEQALRELHPLFASEEERLHRHFVEEAEAFLGEAKPSGLATLRKGWAEGRFEAVPRARGLEFANRVARDLITPWFGRAEERGEAAYREAAGRFTALANEQLARLAAAAGVETSGLSHIGPAAEGFTIARHFAFSDRMSFHYPLYPWPGLIDALVPASVRRRRRLRRAEAYLIDLLTVNASRVAGDLTDRVRESRRQVEAEIRETLRQSSETAAAALTWALAVRARGADEVRLEGERLETLLNQVERLLQPAGHRAA